VNFIGFCTCAGAFESRYVSRAFTAQQPMRAALLALGGQAPGKQAGGDEGLPVVRGVPLI